MLLRAGDATAALREMQGESEEEADAASQDKNVPDHVRVWQLLPRVENHPDHVREPAGDHPDEEVDRDRGEQRPVEADDEPGHRYVEQVGDEIRLAEHR